MRRLSNLPSFTLLWWPVIRAPGIYRATRCGVFYPGGEALEFQVAVEIGLGDALTTHRRQAFGVVAHSG